MTELLPRKAKRRIWSLRRRGAPFSPIFRRATKDGAHGVRRISREVGKNVQRKMEPTECVGLVERQVNSQNLKLYTTLNHFDSTPAK